MLKQNTEVVPVVKSESRFQRAKNAIVFGAMVGATAITTPAHAAGIDVTAVVKAIEEVAPAAAAIGAAILIMTVGIKVWKWVKGAMS